MESRELVQIRHKLGKTQKELGQLLSVSAKAVQSYEQGWRRIPGDIERQLLLLVSLTVLKRDNVNSCWELKDCPEEWREKCMVWQYRVNRMCWMVSGTFCNGSFQNSWREKMDICRECPVFSALIPF